MHLVQSSYKLLFAAILAVAPTLAGCAAHYPKTDETMKSPQATFDVPPRQLLATAKKVVTSPPLSLTIEEEQNGSFLTSGQRFPGEWHIARRWQEQTKYRVTIVPAFDDPNKSSLQVRDFTQQRAIESMKWENAADLQRPDRAEQLIKEIAKAVNAGATGGATTTTTATTTAPAR